MKIWSLLIAIALLALSGCSQGRSGDTLGPQTGANTLASSEVTKTPRGLVEPAGKGPKRHIQNFDDRRPDEPYAHLGFYSHGCLEYGWCAGAGTKSGTHGGKSRGTEHSRPGSKFVGRK